MKTKVRDQVLTRESQWKEKRLVWEYSLIPWVDKHGSKLTNQSEGVTSRVMGVWGAGAGAVCVSMFVHTDLRVCLTVYCLRVGACVKSCVRVCSCVDTCNRDVQLWTGYVLRALIGAWISVWKTHTHFPLSPSLFLPPFLSPHAIVHNEC